MFVFILFVGCVFGFVLFVELALYLRVVGVLVLLLFGLFVFGVVV